MLTNGNFTPDEIRALKRKRRRLKNRIYSSKSRASAETGFRHLLYEVEGMRRELKTLGSEGSRLETEASKLSYMIQSMEEKIGNHGGQ